MGRPACASLPTCHRADGLRARIAARLGVGLAMLCVVACAGPASNEASVVAPAVPKVGEAAPAASRTVARDAVLPPIAPLDRPFIVMAWEARTSAPGLDWVAIAGPLGVAEAVERVLGWTPRYGGLVVDVAAGTTAAQVAERARASGASYVFTGWYDRPNWAFAAGLSLWRVDGVGAVQIAQATASGPLADSHLIMARLLSGILREAGMPVDQATESRLLQPLTRDNYSLMLTARGLKGVLAGLTPQSHAPVLADLTKASRIDPTNALIMRLLGEFWHHAQATPEALAAADRSMALAAELDPTYGAAVVGAAAAAAARGVWRDADLLYGKAIALRRWDLSARVGWARARIATERYGDAIEALLEVKRVRPELLEARRLLATAYDAIGELDALVQELLAVAALAPGDEATQLELAAAYIAGGDIARASEALAPRAAGDVPISFKLWMGDMARHLGRAGEAISWYEQAIVSDAGPVRRAGLPPLLHPRAVYERAMLRARDASVEDAMVEAALEDVVAIPELASQSPWIRAEAAFYRGRFAAAADAFGEAIALYPDDLDTRYNLVWTLLMNKTPKAAQVAAAAAIARMPGQVDLAYILAASHFQAGEASRARQGLTDVLALDPTHVDAQRAATAIDNGAPMLAHGGLRPHRAFTDVVLAQREIEQVIAGRKARDGVRGAWFAASRDILTVLGRLPLSETRRVRRCPAANVAQLLARQRELERHYLQLGVDLQRLETKIENARLFGDVEFLSRFARLRADEVVAGVPQAELDLREMWFTRDVLVAGELAAAGCTATVLAAAYDPSRRQAPPLPIAPTPKPTSIAATVITFFVDNRGCPDVVEVTVDGLAIGRVEPSVVRGFSSNAGGHTVCLTGPGVACGVQGTVREVYLHDGLTIGMRCP
ncbi:MAG: hypothetical protein IPL79_03290 [Myxococcales bacterium]|nr:hypothetical protein [Myxococcales bacterium]